MSLVETEAEAFLSESKSLVGRVKWHPLPDAPYIHRAVVKILLTQSGDTTTLDLVLTYNQKALTFIYILRYAHRENIRRLEFNKRHANPGSKPK